MSKKQKPRHKPNKQLKNHYDRLDKVWRSVVNIRYTLRMLSDMLTYKYPQGITLDLEETDNVMSTLELCLDSLATQDERLDRLVTELSSRLG